MKEYLFSEYLRSSTKLSNEQMEQLFKRSKVLMPKKGEFLLTPGQLCKHRFFIEQGAVREYSIDEKGREHLLHFAIEGWFLMNVNSIFFNQPSDYFIETIEPSRILLLDEDEVQHLIAEDSSFDNFTKNLLYEHIQVLQRRITSLQSDSAEERYLYFTQTYPEIMSRVPQLMIASYLGITPESLSRIRRELAERHYTPPRNS
ncbi:hypothetical protein HQ36_07935 [Porphyromonas gingivicanis]|uniref:Cyclic nucleotide-binding domain-containing protein n=1 Tax=Porphyromonas gingivicanis TaxID=266762 RepID=A0A0A2G4H5_9PORP|nr:Crp/Fnr family transcriptional regulator [Porphyromonas gingivicanis]KGN97265.1 hypothetical protein HQ36_07935 [Porphyromonas gingivicanis]